MPRVEFEVTDALIPIDNTIRDVSFFCMVHRCVRKELVATVRTEKSMYLVPTSG